jgi:putative ABC transport system permease protein
MRVVVFVIVTATMTSLIWGLVPAVRVSSPARFVQRQRPRNALIIAEIALALVLLAGTSLLLKSYLRVNDVSPGLRTHNVLTVELSIPRSTYPTAAEVSRFYRRLLANLDTLPGIESAATIRMLPFGGRSNFAQFDVRGAPPRSANEEYGFANLQVVSVKYFNTASVKLLTGRSFTDQDGQGTLPVAIINDALARRVWKSVSPIGAQIRIGPPEWGQPWLTIVGVSSNVLHYGLDQRVPLEIYTALDQTPERDTALFLTTKIDPSVLVAGVRQKIYEVDPEQAASAVRAMEQVIDDSLWQRRVLLWIMLLFAGVALVLSSIAVYGVIAFSIQQRRSEFGIRIAIGAQRRDILKLAVSEGMWLVGIGIMIGLAGSVALMRAIGKLLYDVQPTDPAVFVAITILVAVVAFIAAYLPARRATVTDPMIVLRVD